MAEKKFEPVQHYKMKSVKKDGKTVKEYELDKKGAKIPLDKYKATEFGEMVAWLKENGSPADIKAFKEACHTKKVKEEVIGPKGGKKLVPTGETTYCEEINPMYAKEWFFTQFAPDYLPKKAEPEAVKTMQDWLNEL